MMIGIIVFCAASTLFAKIDVVKDAEIPMLQIIGSIHPALASVYAVVIFALVFNTAFSLFYATARRFAGNDDKKMKIALSVIVAAGYLCSFGGFRTLVSRMYPLLGYMGSLLLVVLLVAWIRNRKGIFEEKFLRRKMIRLHIKKHDKNRLYTAKDQELFASLGEKSIADTKRLSRKVKAYAHEIIQSPVDTDKFVQKQLPKKKGS